MVAINNNTISEKGDGAEALLKNTRVENVSLTIGVLGTVRSKKTLFVFVFILIVVLLCTVTLALGIWLKSERQLPPFCCPCDKLDTPGTVRKGKSICCIDTESEYVQTMKHMLNRPEPESKLEESEDPKAFLTGKISSVPSWLTDSRRHALTPEYPKTVVTEIEKKMLVAKNETITLLHSSPVAAHVLVACTNSSYYPYPEKVQDLPPTRTLELLPRRSLSLLRGVKLNRDHLVIQTRGLYLIYSQIYFKVIQGTNWPLDLNLLCHIVERYNRRIPNDGIEKLLQSTHTLPKRVHPGNTMFDFHTSYISGVVELEVNDEVFVRASLEDVVSRYPTLNYLGLVKLDSLTLPWKHHAGPQPG